MKKIFNLSLMLIIFFACQKSDVDEQVIKVINFFTKNPSQLNNLMYLQIVPRGSDTFIYGIDSLGIGLYLIDFSIDDISSIQISNSKIVDSLLANRGLKDIESFKRSTIKTAYINLKLMSRLGIRSLSSCNSIESCCIEFILFDDTVVYYLCGEKVAQEKLKKMYGEKIKIVNERWLYLIEGVE